MQFTASTPSQRDSFRRFESVHAQWCAATEALAAAELRLWTETLRDPRSQALYTLAEEVLRLRQLAQDAHRGMPAADDGMRVPPSH